MRGIGKSTLPIVVLLCIFVLFVQIVKRRDTGNKMSQSEWETLRRVTNSHEPIHIATVICDTDAAQLFQSLVHSAVFMSQAEVNFHLVADTTFLRNILQNILHSLPEYVQFRVKFHFYSMQNTPREDWNNGVRKCMYQRVLLPDMLRTVDRVIVLDAEILVTGQLEKIWAQFDEFTADEIMGASNDCPYEGCGYFSKVIHGEAHVPTVWESGLNAAVLFLKLGELRRLQVGNALSNLATKEYNKTIVYIDQDMYNIYYSLPKNAKRLKHIDCSFNFMPWFYCNEPNVCNTHEGLFLINGSGGQLIDGSFFKLIQKVFHDMEFKKNREQMFSDFMEEVKKLKARDSCPKLMKYLFRKS